MGWQLLWSCWPHNNCEEQNMHKLHGVNQRLMVIGQWCKPGLKHTITMWALHKVQTIVPVELSHHLSIPSSGMATMGRQKKIGSQRKNWNMLFIVHNPLFPCSDLSTFKKGVYVMLSLRRHVHHEHSQAIWLQLPWIGIYYNHRQLVHSRNISISCLCSLLSLQKVV